MDYLKSRAPFWKKEVVNGKENWVEAIAADETALSRWR
jgi:molybdopterin synthase catalytic subunit